MLHTLKNTITHIKITFRRIINYIHNNMRDFIFDIVLCFLFCWLIYLFCLINDDAVEWYLVPRLPKQFDILLTVSILVIQYPIVDIHERMQRMIDSNNFSLDTRTYLEDMLYSTLLDLLSCDMDRKLTIVNDCTIYK